MNILRTERGQYPRIDVCYLAMPCQHCQDAPCVKAHPDIISRREDGIVLIDPVKAKGKEGLEKSCPYGAIYWNEELKVAQKCTMCAHIIDGGDEPRVPRCAHSCPTGALSYHVMEPAQMAEMVKSEGLETYRPEFGTRPNVFYKNLYRFTKAFVAGGILKDGECASGVELTLQGPGVSGTQTTDGFGDFKFDALTPGEYTLLAAGKELRKVSLTESVNLGSLTL